MKRMLLLLACSALAWPAGCTLSGSYALSGSAGHWTGSGCTGGSFIPGNGDTVTIPNGLKLTVDQGWTIGSSPATGGTPAIYTSTSGVVEVASGATLRERGDIVADAAGGFSPYMIMDAGSSLVIDASQASSPSTTRYHLGPTASVGTRGLTINGTALSHVSVRSDLTNGALPAILQCGAIGSPCQYSYFPVVGTYGDFSYIGDSSYPSVRYNNWSGDTTPLWSIAHFTFDHCGPFGWWNDNYGLASHGSFLFDSNTFTNSAGTSDMYLVTPVSPATGTTWIIRNNVFAKRFADADGGCNGGLWGSITFSGNYFANGMCSANTFVPSTVSTTTDNFFRLLYTNQLALPGSGSGGYMFVDVAGMDNVHLFQLPMGVGSTITEEASNFVAEVPDDYTTDSGETILGWTNNPSYSATLRNVIVIPSKTGNQTMELQSSTSSIPNNWGPLSVLHNTWVGGGGYHGMIQTNESGAQLMALNALESNLAWSLSGPYPKVGTVQSTYLFQNPVTTADYNSADRHLTLTDPACTGCTNQGRGYIGKWTATPGVHDVTAEPYLADALLRNVALWDTRYLGHAAATAWNGAGHVYAVGDLVGDSHTGYWGGATINFRCIAAHTSGATTEPNVGANWRNDWEFASLVDLRSATAAGTTYTDGAIGCAGCTAIQALVKWVQRGYVPQNPALWCVGHDGETIGAVPFCAAGKVMIGVLAGM